MFKRIDEKIENKESVVFGNCKICNDLATGIHYGVATCQGCKSFYKRALSRKDKYHCFFGMCCPITPRNRHRCKACRFVKCKQVGMSVKKIKLGRIPKCEIKRIYLNSENSMSSSPTIINDEETTTSDNHTQTKVDIIELNNNRITISVFKEQMHALYTTHSDRVQATLEETKMMHSLTTKSTMKDLLFGVVAAVQLEISSMISFVKDMPGDLHKSDDFLTIVNTHLFNFYILMNSPLCINGESFYMLPNGVQYSKERIRMLIGDESTEARFEFTQKFNELGLTNKEKSLIMPFIFTIHEATIKNPKQLLSLHEFYSKALVYEMCSNKRDLAFLTKFNETLELLPKLNELEQKNFRNVKIDAT